MHVSSDDVAVMLAEVGRFARERVEAAAARPELPMGDDVLAALSAEAVAMGVLPASGDAGFALWAQPRDAASVAFSLGAVRQLGRANAGVAFAWHRAALARSLAAQLALPCLATGALDLTVVPTGHFGLARTSAARWLHGAPADDDDTRLMADWLDRQAHTTPLIAPRAWSVLLWPVWQKGRVTWYVVQRHQLGAPTCRPQHGLDELAAYTVRALAPVGIATPCDDGASRRGVAHALTLDWLGLLAIALGALERGQQMAITFAGIRLQGGTVIARHPAVQRMLSEIDAARQQADLTLASFAGAVDDLDLGAVAAARATLHPMLCDAASQVVQVQGGIGYMRDAGPEKILRDLNVLKLQGGGVLAAHAFMAGWAEASL